MKTLAVGILLAGAICTMCICLADQLPGGRLIFIESAQIAAVSAKPRVPLAHMLPSQVRAAEYSLDFARRELAPALRDPVAVEGEGRLESHVAEVAAERLLVYNAAAGGFRDLTTSAKIIWPAGSVSATFCDYDRSGHPSLFIVGVGGVTLYHNNGNGTFSNLTERARLRGNPNELDTSAVLEDIDGDGLPDLLVTAYTRLDRPPTTPVFAFPNDFPGAVSRLYRNNGDGTFSDITKPAGIGDNPGRARKAIVADFNDDRRPDILILRDDKPPVFYLNRGHATFEDHTWDAGETLTRNAFFDGAVADFDRDGNPDIALWCVQSFRVLLNRGNAVFEPAESMPLIDPIFSLTGFRGTVVDLDGNGFPDVLMVARDSRWHVFLNQSGKFREMTPETPAGFEGGYFVPFSLRSPRSTLLAVRPDGKMSLLQSTPLDATNRTPKP
jgi:hypothetical protein